MTNRKEIHVWKYADPPVDIHLTWQYVGETWDSWIYSVPFAIKEPEEVDYLDKLLETGVEVILKKESDRNVIKAEILIEGQMYHLGYTVYSNDHLKESWDTMIRGLYRATQRLFKVLTKNPTEASEIQENRK